MVAGLRAEDEAEALLFQQPDVRPVRRQPVPDDDRFHVRMLSEEAVDEPFRRAALAVVLRRPVTVADRLRRQRRHLLMVSGWMTAAPRI